MVAPRHTGARTAFDRKPREPYSAIVNAAIWAIIGLVLILLEFVAPDLVVIFFGLGALLNALLVAVSPGLQQSIPLQITLWAATSVLSLALLRRYAARWFLGKEAETETYTGETAEVIETIPGDGEGRVRLRGTSWRARAPGEDILTGTMVRVVSRDNLTLFVTAQDAPASHGTHTNTQEETQPQ